MVVDDEQAIAARVVEVARARLPAADALLTARLDQLDDEERSVLERGAIEGRIFHRGAVQALAPEETQVTPRLAVNLGLRYEQETLWDTCTVAALGIPYADRGGHLLDALPADGRAKWPGRGYACFGGGGDYATMALFDSVYKPDPSRPRLVGEIEDRILTPTAYSPALGGM